ncbi:MAG: TOMM precursor leader peptide-binding protein [Xenococcaceae cyanobacterium]
MLKVPKFKSYFHIEVVPSVGVFLLSESDYYILTGELYEKLVPLINGDRSVDDLVAILGDRVSVAEIYYALMLMEQKGYIVENTEIVSPEVEAFWDFLSVDASEAHQRLQSTGVSITALSNIPTQPLSTALQQLNIQAVPSGEIEIVLTDDYLRIELEQINHKALESRRPWMLVKPVGKIIWIGPIFYPGKTGCWQCLAQRLQANRPLENFIRERKTVSNLATTSRAALPSTMQTAINLAATEIAKWLVQSSDRRLEGKIATFDTISWQIKEHTLTKRPQCPACGNPEHPFEKKPSPITIQSRQKSFTADGGHRSVSPEQTLQKYQHHISPITGAVRGLSRITRSPSELTPNYIAGHNFASMFDSLYFLKENLRGRSAGKGKTDAQAKASALGEAIERYSGVFQGNEIRRKGSYATMGDVAIHPNECMLFSDYQYQTRHEWNDKCPSHFQRVPEPFDPDREIEWTPIWSLTHEEFKYLPTAYCYYGYREPFDRSCWADSNGTAAGNSKEEAILQGFMELVERDCVALWWYNRLKRPRVDLDSFEQPYFHALKEYYHSLDRELWVLDITNDFNIPAFAALSRRHDRGTEDIIYGFGAHFDPLIAITRALTEANQVLPAVLAKKPDDSTDYSCADELAKTWWQNATIENQPYLLPDPNIAPKTLKDYPQLGTNDLRDDIITCVNIARDRGLETLVLDQTRPDIGLNVVKVVVPGLRHFWKRWGKGRLYDLPVELGQLARSRQENELNPYPIFF